MEGGEVSRGEKFHCTPFLSDILQPISWAHPSWMTIALWFAYQKRFSDTRLPSHCERLENIDNYWQIPKHGRNSICNIASTILFSYFLPSYESTLLTQKSDCCCRSLWGELGRQAVLACCGSDCRWVLYSPLLLVCAYFLMTQTLIKIIITLVPHMALLWGLFRLRPGLYKPHVISYSAFGQTLWLQW